MKKLPNKLVRFYSSKLNLALLLAVLSFFAATLTLRYFTEDLGKSTVASQALQSELAVARGGANAIEGFLDLTGKHLVLLAKEPNIVSESPEAQDTLEEFIADWEGTPIIGIVLTDDKGIVRFNANKKKEPDLDISMADREYFLNSKDADQGSIFVGKPVLARLTTYKDQFIITLTTPVYEDKEFKGVLNTAVLLPELAETYLSPLKITPSTEIYLLSLDGIILHSPYQELIGVKISDYLRQFPFPGNEANIKIMEEHLAEAKENSLELAWPDSYDKTDFTKYLFAYSPIEFNGRAWLLGVAAPFNDVLTHYQSYYKIAIAELLIAFVFIVVFMALIVFALKSTQRKGYLDGFNHGKNHNEKGK